MSGKAQERKYFKMTINELNARKAERLDNERAEHIDRILANVADDGRNGRAFELSCARSLSNKTNVSAQGRVDVSVKVMVNGKAKYMPAECKTNGGRIDDLLDGSNKSKFVIYELNTVQKHKASKTRDAWEEIRAVPAVIVPTELFLSMLIDCNAIKNVAHGGVVDGKAIQPTSKKMFERLTAYADNYPSMVFDREYTYESWDFEGLEL